MMDISVKVFNVHTSAKEVGVSNNSYNLLYSNGASVPGSREGRTYFFLQSLKSTVTAIMISVIHIWSKTSLELRRSNTFEWPISTLVAVHIQYCTISLRNFTSARRIIFIHFVSKKFGSLKPRSPQKRKISVLHKPGLGLRDGKSRIEIRRAVCENTSPDHTDLKSRETFSGQSICSTIYFQALHYWPSCLGATLVPQLISTWHFTIEQLNKKDQYQNDLEHATIFSISHHVSSWYYPVRPILTQRHNFILHILFCITPGRKNDRYRNLTLSLRSKVWEFKNHKR